MIVLLLFAAVAGAGTALTPCVLPVLPAVLSAGALGGARRPLGIGLGLVGTFTVTIVGLAEVVDGVGAGTGVLRWVAVAVLLAFGLALAFPAIGDRIEAPLSRLARFGPGSSGHGFWSGLAVGGALGFVCAPCAGPILAAVISVSASQGTSARLVAVGLAYAGGLGTMLALYAYGGRRVIDRVRRAGRGPSVQRVLGGMLAATALVMALQLDVRFETALAGHVPDFLVDPTHSLERSHAIEGRLADLRGRARFEAAASARPSRHRPAARAALRELRRRAGLHRPRPLVQHRRAPAHDVGPARPRRADRLLDLHVHQLPAHAALPARAGRPLPPRRPDGRRGAHARVRVRARLRQRGRGDPGQSPALSGRPGQRLRDVERLRQPVLAGRVPGRRRRPRPLRPVRRGRRGPDRGRRALAARGGRSP